MYSHESTEMFGSECQRFIFNHGDNGLLCETCFGQLNCLTSFFLRKIFTSHPQPPCQMASGWGARPIALRQLTNLLAPLRQKDEPSFLHPQRGSSLKNLKHSIFWEFEHYAQDLLGQNTTFAPAPSNMGGGFADFFFRCEDDQQCVLPEQEKNKFNQCFSIERS